MAEDQVTARDQLSLDTVSNVVGIDPNLLYAADEQFLLYSPTCSNYLFMSKDPSLSDKMHTKLEVRENRDSERNFFKLVKVDQKDAFYLYNVKTEKFVYIHGESALGMTGNPSEKDDKGRFIFETEIVDGNGCYKMKNDGKYMFVSKSTAGIPPNRVIQVGTEAPENLDIFQFVLEKDAKEAKIEFDLAKVKKFSVPLDEITYEFENEEGNEARIEEPKVDREYPKKERFVFQGLTYSGKYNGGYPARSADGFCLISSNIERSTQTEDGVNKENSSFKITAPPGKLTILKVEVTQYLIEAPFILHLTTSSKKTLITNGVWTGDGGLFTNSVLQNKPLKAAEE